MDGHIIPPTAVILYPIGKQRDIIEKRMKRERESVHLDAP